MNTVEAFGVILKKYRKIAKLTQEELAMSCNLDRTYISLLERSKRQPSISTIFILANVLKVSPHQMIKDVEDLLSKS